MLISAAGACATAGTRAFAASAKKEDPRTSVIERSRVWSPTNIASKDLKTGPTGPGAFTFRETVTCKYLDKKLSGKSPKFACLIGEDDEVKVKFGGNNGEVYGEVLATRLLWALGFPADRMYPVNVICKGCPEDFLGIVRPNDESRFDPAVIERKIAGQEWGEKGWSWKEIDRLDSERAAPRAHRDALKLLAVFMQHSDSKPVQQRIVCQSNAKWPDPSTCDSPFLMISDVGLTFGRATRSNANEPSGVNLEAWRQTPVWKDDEARCVGNLPKSFTGTLSEPVISEAGRKFLADLLTQLSDRQLFDLFEVSRVRLRLRSPGKVDSGFATEADWVEAFKAKRDQIVKRSCA